MLDLPNFNNVNVSGKSVLVRGEFNVEDGNNARADSIREIVKCLQDKNAAKIKIIGHTETKYDLALQLRGEFPGVEFDNRLRDNPGEKNNDINFAEELAVGWNVYINEAFATSHREHASFINLPKVIKRNGGEVGVGTRFMQEIENLSRIFSSPKRPVIMVISGVKEDKLSYVEAFSEFADEILIGGRLPGYLDSNKQEAISDKLVVADLIADKEDITIHSIEKFEKEIAGAGTIVVSGPVGKFEDPGHRQGTDRVFRAVVNNKDAFKVAGGGDTEQAISVLEIRDGWDWVSVGGGAMLEFLANKTLPGIEALLDI